MAKVALWLGNLGIANETTYLPLATIEWARKHSPAAVADGGAIGGDEGGMGGGGDDEEGAGGGEEGALLPGGGP